MDPDIEELKRAGKKAELLQALGGNNPSKREEAASALGEIGGEAAVQPLFDAFKAGAIPRKRAIESISRAGGERAASRIAEIIIDTDGETRKEIAREIAEIGPQLVSSGEFWRLICAGTYWFDQKEKDAARRSVEALLACLESPDLVLRREALHVIIMIDLRFDETTAKRIAGLLENKEHELIIVERVVEILGRCESQGLADVFLKCLDSDFLASFARTAGASSDRSLEIYAKSIFALSRICDEGIARRLVPVLKRELLAQKDSQSVETANKRRACICALLELTGEFIPAELLGIIGKLEGFYNEQREIAKRIAPKDIPDDLIPTLAEVSDKPYARELLKKKGPLAAKELIRRFTEMKEKHALEALVDMELDAAALAPLVEKFSDLDPDTIEYVRWCLSRAKIDDPSVKAYGAFLGKDMAAQ